MASRSITSFFAPKAAAPASPSKRVAAAMVPASPSKRLKGDAAPAAPTTPTHSHTSAESTHPAAAVDSAPTTTPAAAAATPSSPLTPEQLRLIEERRLQALERRQQKSMQGTLEAQTMGASWQRVLQAEFAKPYFLKVCVTRPVGRPAARAR